MAVEIGNKMNADNFLIKRILETGCYQNKNILERFLLETRDGVVVKINTKKVYATKTEKNETVGKIKCRFATIYGFNIPSGVSIERSKGKDIIFYHQIISYKILE